MLNISHLLYHIRYDLSFTGFVNQLYAHVVKYLNDISFKVFDRNPVSDMLLENDIE